MMHLFKADFYRIPREKVGLIPLGILTFLIGIVCFFSREYKDVSVLTLLSPITLVVVLTIISSGLYFWGNDFQHRTVNNLISKKVSRKKIFTYKVLATMVLSLVYNLFAFVLLALCRQIFTGANEWAILAESFLQSLLFYLVLVAFIILLFNLLKTNALAITAYSLYLLVFEQLVMLMLGFISSAEILGNVFWVRNYQNSIMQATPEMFVFAVITLIAFLVASYLLFSKHELK